VPTRRNPARIRARCEARLSRAVSAITLDSPLSLAIVNRANDRLGGVAVAAGRRDQAVADLDATVLWLALEADPPDGLSVGKADDPVEAERPLLSARCGPKKAPYCANVTLEGEIVRPSILRPGGLSDDAFSLRDIDRMQL
jgi:hypothetical protein